MDLNYYNHSDNDNDDRPKTPLKEDCCNSGCEPCIFDIHKRLLSKWESRRKQNIKIKTTNNLLSPLSYKTFTIIDISVTSEDCILIHLEYQECKTQKDINLYLEPGQYIILHSWKISRPYTPIAWTCAGLVLLIKIYKNGEFSRCLRDASLGNIIDVRGPYGDFKYKSNSIGSGIAPLYPIAKSIIDDENEFARVHLIAGFQSLAHVPLKKELGHLTSYWNFKCTLQLSQSNDETIDLHGFDIKIGRISKLFIVDYLECNDIETTLILICGTSEFNHNVKILIQEMNYTHIHIFE